MPRSWSIAQRRSLSQDVTQSAVDSGQLVPMTDAVESNLGRKPQQLSADAGYCSEANLEALENRDIDGYVATGRARDAVDGHVKDGGDDAPGAPATAMRGERRPQYQDRSRGRSRSRPHRPASKRCVQSSRPAGMRAPTG